MPTIDEFLAEHYAALMPAAFNGLPFIMAQGPVSGGWDFAVERRFGRGSVPRPKQPAVTTIEITGVIDGGDFTARAQALEAAFKAGVGDLDHPWYGRLRALAERFRFEFSAGHIGQVPFTASFVLAELAEQPTSGAPQTLAETQQALITASAAFADEPLVLEQLELLSGALALEPTGLTGAAFTQQMTTAIVGGAGTAGLAPDAIKAMSDAAIAADGGELTRTQFDLTESCTWNAASATSSLGLIQQLEAVQLFVGVTGAGALARLQEGVGENVQALAVRTGQPLEVVAGRNRSAVQFWFARGEIRV